MTREDFLEQELRSASQRLENLSLSNARKDSYLYSAREEIDQLKIQLDNDREALRFCQGETLRLKKIIGEYDDILTGEQNENRILREKVASLEDKLETLRQMSNLLPR